jgi:hypothetical protein
VLAQDECVGYRERGRRTFMKTLKRFPVISLKIPWSSAIRLYSCGFGAAIFFSGKKFPDKFPAQGIMRHRLR